MLINLLNLAWDEFQNLICDIYQNEGFNIDFRSGLGPDGNRDIVISKTIDDSLTTISTKYVVQCKRHKKAVIQSDVTDISDTIERYGANGFILAVTSNVSQPLLNKMADLSATKGFYCHALLPTEIHDLLVKHIDTFAKYFPAECEKYGKATKAIYGDDIIQYLRNSDDIDLSNDELEIIRKDLIFLDISNLNEYKKIMMNPELSALINELFDLRIKRKPNFAENCHYMILLSHHDPKNRKNILDTELMSTPEFLSRVRLTLNFNALPKANICFNEVYQTAFYFSTYHYKHKIGRLKVVDTDTPPHPKAIKMNSTTKNEFRLICLNKSPIPSKKILTIDYVIDGFFQLFIRVIGNDNRLYYIQYIDGEGKGNIINDRGSIYVQFYGKGTANGPRMLRKELYFYDDLLKACGTVPEVLTALYIGVKGSLTIYQIMII